MIEAIAATIVGGLLLAGILGVLRHRGIRPFSDPKPEPKKPAPQLAPVDLNPGGPQRIPPPPPDFTGRREIIDEIKDLAQETDEQDVLIYGVRGMGGVGKSALAFQVTKELAGRYPDGQLFLDMRGTDQDPPPAEELLVEAIQSLDPEAKISGEASLQQLSATYRSLLDGRQMIVLADNAASRAQTQPLTPPSGCLFLVTSRLHFQLPGIRTKNLDVLGSEEAGALVRKICPRVSEEEAVELAEKVGRLPLAVRLAASALAVREDWGVAGYLERLADSRQRLGLGDGVEGVEASISLSWDLLGEGDQARLARLAVFPASFDQLALRSVWELEEGEADAALDPLLRASLVQWDGEAGRYRLHDLVRDFAGERLGEAEQFEASLRHAAHYRGVLALADDLYLKGGDHVLQGLQLFDRERVHIEAGFVWARGQGEEHETAARLVMEYPNAGLYVLTLRLAPRERIAWLEPALAAARRLGEREAEGVHLGNLAIQHHKLGEHETAEGLYQKQLAATQETGDRKSEATALHNLGILAQKRGNLDEARESYGKALEIFEELGDRAGMANTYHEMGRVAQASGDLDEARGWYGRSLKIEEELGNRAGMAISYHEMGRVAQASGDPDEARRWYGKALEIFEELGDRAGMAQSLGQLGILAAEQGRPGDGVPLNLHSLSIRLDLGSPDIRIDLYWLSRQREMLGEERFQKVLDEHLDEQGRDAMFILLEQYQQAVAEATEGD